MNDFLDQLRNESLAIYSRPTFDSARVVKVYINDSFLIPYNNRWDNYFQPPEVITATSSESDISWWWWFLCGVIGSIMVLLVVFFLRPCFYLNDKTDFDFEDSRSESSTSDSEVSTPQEVRKTEMVENIEPKKRKLEKQAPTKNPLDVW